MTSVNSIGKCSCNVSATIDYEYMRIIKRLAEYGEKPSGSKTSDRIKLHELELREAEKENCITTKFLTVSIKEQEDIQEKKKKKREDINPELKENPTMGQEILGQQLLIAIEMKNNKKIKNKTYDY